MTNSSRLAALNRSDSEETVPSKYRRADSTETEFWQRTCTYLQSPPRKARQTVTQLCPVAPALQASTPHTVWGLGQSCTAPQHHKYGPQGNGRQTTALRTCSDHSHLGGWRGRFPVSPQDCWCQRWGFLLLPGFPYHQSREGSMMVSSKDLPKTKDALDSYYHGHLCRRWRWGTCVSF